MCSRHAGLLFPEIRRSAEGLPRDGSWLAKTYAGASGSGVRTWDEEQGARSEERGSDLVCYQRRIDGMPCAAVFRRRGRRSEVARRHAATHRRAVARFARLSVRRFDWSVARIGSNAQARSSDWAAVSEQFELIGLFGVDFILDGDTVWTLEVNPRYTASVEIVERFTGKSAIAEHAAACGAALGPTTARHPTSFSGHAVKQFCLHAADLSYLARSLSVRSALALEKPWPSLGGHFDRWHTDRSWPSNSHAIRRWTDRSDVEADCAGAVASRAGIREPG